MAASPGRHNKVIVMTELTVELRNVSKIYPARRSSGKDVVAVREVSLDIPSGEFFTLLGPSGCGKTTTLRLIAGFEQPTSGEVYLQGKAVSKIPTYKRPVNTVFQNYALFPHMTVAKNVGFGLTVKRVPKAERERRVMEALELVQLPDLANRKPSQLSGGQQQRVALARALVNRPTVLLLDEPLGALDLKLRKAMQLELKQLQERLGITFVYVTHDQEEALTMSDRIAVMNYGEALQVGDPMTLYEKPANSFVADFIGESNFVRGTVKQVDDDEAQIAIGRKVIAVRLEEERPSPNQNVLLTIRPEKLWLSEPDEQADGLPGVVEEVVYIGTSTRYIVALEAGDEIVVRLQNRPGTKMAGLGRGAPVKVSWRFEDARIIEADGRGEELVIG